MMLPAAKKAHWVRRIFLEWVAVCVGAEERKSKKIQRCVNRRREFFTPGALHSGCRIHLDRRLTGVTSLSPSHFGEYSLTSPREVRPGADPYRGVSRDWQPANIGFHKSSSAGELQMPGGLHARLMHYKHMQHVGFGD